MDVMFTIILVAAICNFILGFLVYWSGPKDGLRRWYGIFGVITGIWVLSNSLTGFFPTVFLIKSVYAIGALVPASAVMWILYFCEEKISRTKKTFIFIFAAAFFVAPFLGGLFLYDVTRVYLGGVDGKYGAAFYLYIAYMFGFLVYAVYKLGLHYKKTSGIEKTQAKFMLIGAFIWVFFVLLTDFVLPLFGIVQFIPLDSPSGLIFLIFTTYAITKHNLFNVKVIATELFIFALWILLLAKLTVSSGYQDFLINLGLLISVVIVGALLIRGILKEVKQREKMEEMAKDIEVAYEEEKKAREEIGVKEAQDEALLSSIGDGVIAVDSAGKIVFINDMAEQMLQIKSADAIGNQYDKVLRVENEKGEVIPRGKNRLDEALTSGQKTVTSATSAPDLMYYYVRADKTRFPAAVTIAPVILDNKTAGAIDVFRDITVERQIDKSKTEFVSLASHQLRTPLSAIKWYSDVLMGSKTEKLSPKQKKYLKEIYHGNERMIKLIDVMLNVSRLDAGKIKNNPELVDVKKTMEDIINEQIFTVKKKKQKFIFNCQDGLPQIFVDTNLFRIVFQNLISNAVKYTPDGGKITCDIKKDDKNISFEVGDTGIGIPEAQQKRIFEKLFRADNASPHDPEGNGLGLYAAKATVETFGGKIWFKSKEGQGTTFYITIPLDKLVQRAL